MESTMSGFRFLISTLLLLAVCRLATSRTIDEIIAGSSDSVNNFDFLADLTGDTIRQELDMMLTKKQYWALQELELADKLIDLPETSEAEKLKLSRKKRKAIKHMNYRWTNNIIPYKIAPGVFNSRDMQEINAAINEWETNTCISFKRASSADPNFVYFDNGSGCYSYVGMTGGSQTIGLAGGCRYKGVIAHEIGHAVGFHHEQNRPDRDEHVIIVRENIPENLYYNFKKYPWSAVSTYDVPYDYQSVMHYGGRAFSRNGDYTIKTRDPAYQEVIGNREGLSFHDIKLANLMYSCSKGCSSSIRCPSQGFLGKDCQCYCPGNPIQLCDGDGTITVRPTRPTTTQRPVTRCVDNNEHCPAWAASEARYCDTNTYVQTYCKLSCGLCTGVPITEKPRVVCKDASKESNCAFWRARGYCTGLYESFMTENCAKTCEVCQSSPVETTTPKKSVSNGLTGDESSVSGGDNGDGNGSEYLSISFATSLIVCVIHFLQSFHV